MIKYIIMLSALSGLLLAGCSGEDSSNCSKGEKLDESTQTCICDKSNHWTGKAGACKCESNYLEISGVCVEKLKCSGTGMENDNVTNTCVCSERRRFIGEPGNCHCDEGYFYHEPNSHPEDTSCCRIIDFDLTEDPNCLDMEDPKPKDNCKFGHYIQMKTSNELKPIRWRVIKVDAEKGVLLMSEYVLDKVKYNETKESVTWENCTLRAWLNGLGDYSEDNFINTAFSSDELAHIQTVTNVDDSYGEAAGGSNTEDRVFILTRDETKKYVGSNRSAYGTPHHCLLLNNGHMLASYCLGKDAEDVLHPVSWWTRTVNPAEMTAKVLSAAAVDAATDVNDSIVGVRPALWIK